MIFKIQKKIFLQIVLLYVTLSGLALYFGDSGWYESDGVSILAASINLPSAKLGKFFLYDYHTQPLTYELNYAFFKIFKEPHLLYLLPAMAGSLAVCFFTLAIYFFSRKRFSVFSGFCLLLFFPEIFYRLLYPNSSVFAMLFFALCLLFLYSDEGNRILSDFTKYTLIGSLSALACFFRVDFLLGLPMLGYLVIVQKKKAKVFLWYLFGAAVVFIYGFFNGIFNPSEIIKTSNIYSHLAKDSSYWTGQGSFAVLFSLTNITVWLAFIFYALYKAINTLRKRGRLTFLIVLPLAILFYPLLAGLTSAHYMLSAVCFAPFLLAKILYDFSLTDFAARLKISFKKIIYLMVFTSIFLQFFSFEFRFYKKFVPYPLITIKPAFIFTHDGPRVLGAYLEGYYQVYRANKSGCRICPLGLAHTITGIIEKSPSDFMIVYAIPTAGNYLISLGLYSVPLFLEMRGYALTYRNDTIILSGKTNKLLIKGLEANEYQNFDQSKAPPGTKLIKIPLVNRTKPDVGKELESFYKLLLSLTGKMRLSVQQASLSAACWAG